MEDVDVLIKDCSIVTMDSKHPFIEKGYIAIKNKKITTVGKKPKSSSLRAAVAIDGTGKVAMPSLVNCHTHVAMTLFRGIAEDKPLDTWSRQIIAPIEAKMKPRNVYDGALLGCLEMIKGGTTCFADMYFHEDMVAQAVEQSGIKAVLAGNTIEAGDSVRGEKSLRDSESFARKFNGYADDRVSVRLGPHALYSCSPSLLRRVREAALRLKVGIPRASG